MARLDRLGAIKEVAQIGAVIGREFSHDLLVHRRQRSSPTVDLAEDDVGIGGPDEGFGLGVVLLDVAVDRGLEVDDRVEHAPFQAAPGESGEEGQRPR